jgi:hypothetical protein
VFDQIIDSEIAAAIGGVGGSVMVANLQRIAFQNEYGQHWEIWKDAFVNGRGIIEQQTVNPDGIEIWFWEVPAAAYGELYARRLQGLAPLTGPTIDCRPAFGFG